MKIRLIVLMAVLSAVLLTGCWDLTEPEDTSLVTVLGITLAGNDRFEILLQDQTLIPGGQQVQKSNWTFDIHKATGSTIYEALQNNSQMNSEKIYLSHTKAIVLSEELVREQGIRPVIDFLERNPEIRQNTLLLISKKGEFEKVFLPNAKLNMDTGKFIEKIVKNRNSNSFITDCKLKDFLELYWDPYNTPYALGVSSVQVSMENSSIEQNYENVNVGTYDIRVGDIAVFKNDKMAGWLTGDESRGFLWAKGQVKGGSINVEYGGKKITLVITQAKSSVTPAIVNGKMKININIQLVADIGESYADINFDDKHVTDQISRTLNSQVTKEVKEAVAASKNLSSDIFGFGNCFFENYPNYWKQNESQSSDYYSKIDVNVRTDSVIQHIGLVKKPVKTVK